AGLIAGAASDSGPKICSRAPCTGSMTWLRAGRLLALTSRLATDPSLDAWGTPPLTDDVDDEHATPRFTIEASWSGSAGVAHFCPAVWFALSAVTAALVLDAGASNWPAASAAAWSWELAV